MSLRVGFTKFREFYFPSTTLFTSCRVKKQINCMLSISLPFLHSLLLGSLKRCVVTAFFCLDNFQNSSRTPRLMRYQSIIITFTYGPRCLMILSKLDTQSNKTCVTSKNQ